MKIQIYVMRQTFIIFFAFLAITTSAQINNRLHWYDGPSRMKPPIRSTTM